MRQVVPGKWPHRRHQTGREGVPLVPSEDVVEDEEEVPQLTPKHPLKPPLSRTVKSLTILITATTTLVAALGGSGKVLVKMLNLPKIQDIDDRTKALASDQKISFDLISGRFGKVEESQAKMDEKLRTIIEWQTKQDKRKRRVSGEGDHVK
jgi:hypothetical protein